MPAKVFGKGRKGCLFYRGRKSNGIYKYAGEDEKNETDSKGKTKGNGLDI